MARYLETTVDKFIFKVATDRLYSPEGVWVREEDGRLRAGISDYQQQRDGDVAFAHLKPAGTRLSSGDEFAEIETIKATVSFRVPVAGQIVETNAELTTAPEIINQEPYEGGWLALMEPTNWPADRATLLNAEAYLWVMKAQAEEELNS